MLSAVTRKFLRAVTHRASCLMRCRVLSSKTIRASSAPGRAAFGERPHSVQTRDSLSPSRPAAAAVHHLVATSFNGIILIDFARPSSWSPRMPHQLKSTSYQARPCLAEVGCAWWLLCHPSPKVKRATHQLLV